MKQAVTYLNARFQNHFLRQSSTFLYIIKVSRHLNIGGLEVLLKTLDRGSFGFPREQERSRGPEVLSIVEVVMIVISVDPQNKSDGCAPLHL